eukprot:GHVN01036881.1.p1 GENE.GHVN01036881.1~~GHVN01036881.1.p1  ORF type:complete len:1110 (-),score=264.37 GHVN01036881.1:166-3495(-)
MFKKRGPAGRTTSLRTSTADEDHDREGDNSSQSSASQGSHLPSTPQGSSAVPAVGGASSSTGTNLSSSPSQRPTATASKPVALSFGPHGDDADEEGDDESQVHIRKSRASRQLARSRRSVKSRQGGSTITDIDKSKGIRGRANEIGLSIQIASKSLPSSSTSTKCTGTVQVPVETQESGTADNGPGPHETGGVEDKRADEAKGGRESGRTMSSESIHADLTERGNQETVALVKLAKERRERARAGGQPDFIPLTSDARHNLKGSLDQTLPSTSPISRLKADLSKMSKIQELTRLDDEDQDEWEMQQIMKGTGRRLLPLSTSTSQRTDYDLSSLSAAIDDLTGDPINHPAFRAGTGISSAGLGSVPVTHLSKSVQVTANRVDLGLDHDGDEEGDDVMFDGSGARRVMSRDESAVSTGTCEVSGKDSAGVNNRSIGEVYTYEGKVGKARGKVSEEEDGDLMEREMRRLKLSYDNLKDELRAKQQESDRVMERSVAVAEDVSRLMDKQKTLDESLRYAQQFAEFIDDLSGMLAAKTEPITLADRALRTMETELHARRFRRLCEELKDDLLILGVDFSPPVPSRSKLSKQPVPPATTTGTSTTGTPGPPGSSEDAQRCGVPLVGTGEDVDEFGRSRTHYLTATRDQQRAKREDRRARRLHRLSPLGSTDKSLFATSASAPPHSTLSRQKGSGPRSQSESVQAINGEGVRGLTDGAAQTEAISREEIEAGWYSSSDEEVMTEEDSLSTVWKDKQDFNSAASNILTEDVSEEFHFHSIVQQFLRCRERHPTLFSECFCALSLVESLTPLVRWELLWWDPMRLTTDPRVLDQGQINQSRAPHSGNSVMTSPTVEGFKWYLSLLEFTEAVEAIQKREEEEKPKAKERTHDTQVAVDIAGDDEATSVEGGQETEKMGQTRKDDELEVVPRTVRKTVYPVVEHWISNCWNPFSLTQTRRVVALIDELLLFREEEDPSFTSVLHGVVNRVKSHLSCLVPAISLEGSKPLTKEAPDVRRMLLSRSARLAICTLMFVDKLSDAVIQHIVMNEVIAKRIVGCKWISWPAKALSEAKEAERWAAHVRQAVFLSARVGNCDEGCAPMLAVLLSLLIQSLHRGCKK